MTDARSKSEIQRDNRDEAIRLRQREGEATNSGPVVNDEEIDCIWLDCISLRGPLTTKEMRKFARRLFAAFAERVAKRLDNTALTSGEAARIVREAAK